MTIPICVKDRNGAGHEISGQVGFSLMEILNNHGLDVEAVCGGACSCATCHVYIEDEWLSRLPEVMPEEEGLLSDLEYKRPESRLSCQIQIEEWMQRMRVTIAPEE